MTLTIILVVIVVCVLAVITMYNQLVTLRNRFKNAFSQIDVQLKRQHDLIPNLIETVKGYAAHERQTLEAVVSARSKAVKDEVVLVIGRQDRGGVLRVLEAAGDGLAQARHLHAFFAGLILGGDGGTRDGGRGRGGGGRSGCSAGGERLLHVFLHDPPVAARARHLLGRQGRL